VARRRPPWSWAGAAVVILACCIGGGWATAIVMAASSRTPPITDTTADLLSAIGGVLAGAISAFVGGSVANRRHEKEETDDRDDR
jgi:hypothetical protein